MSWIHDLYETYNNCQSDIGKYGLNGERPLLPICHIAAQAHIEISISKTGEFRRARVITDKAMDATTIVPCTEGSASRSGSKPECHPLCDKLQYVAGDFADYGGIVTSGFAKGPGEPYRNFVKVLSNWCESEFSHPKVEAILKYILKKQVVKDLVEHKILFARSDGKFAEKGEVNRQKNALDIYSVVNSQENAFIRWIVEIPGVLETEAWNDKTLWDSWIGYYLGTRKKEPLCFVTGEESILSNNHPKYIRRGGDGAKLISSNDTSGFTFRGRFLFSEQACNVSLEVSQKAHYALMWLIDRQGKVFLENEGRDVGYTVVAWAISGAKILNPTNDLLSTLGQDELPIGEAPTANTAQEVAIRFKKRLVGYGKKFGDTTDIVVMGLDSATPGRMAITYYRKLKGSDFLQRIDDWHKTCAWLHRYGSIEVIDKASGKPKRKYIPFIGAPAPSDIAEAAYGRRVDDSLRKATIARILPCIIDGQPIPRDLVESAVRRACNRVALDDWEWNKTLSIACALFRKYNRKENYDMALDPDRKTRDYLYGRLLALAESLEEWALNTANEKRATNAARLMQRFAERPYSTWRTIELALAPYKARLGGKATKRLRMIDEVIASFTENDFLSDKRLSGEFLLGYHCQREYLRGAAEKGKAADDNDDEE